MSRSFAREAVSNCGAQYFFEAGSSVPPMYWTSIDSHRSRVSSFRDLMRGLLRFFIATDSHMSASRLLSKMKTRDFPRSFGFVWQFHRSFDRARLVRFAWSFG